MRGKRRINTPLQSSLIICKQMVKAELFSVVTDTHGDQQDDESVDALFQFMDVFKPTIRVHAGDAFDMRNLRNGASQKEKSESQQEDIDAGLSFLNRYFK